MGRWRENSQKYYHNKTGGIIVELLGSNLSMEISWKDYFEYGCTLLLPGAAVGDICFFRDEFKSKRNTKKYRFTVQLLQNVHR